MTKTIALTLAALMGSATLAAADADTFGFGRNLDEGSLVTLALVRASGDGVVELYDFNTGEQGALLGMTDVHAGANADVRINLGLTNRNDVIAVLKVDGQIVATQDYDVDPR